MKKYVVVGIGSLIVIILLLLVVFIGDKTLDLESDTVQKLYSYLGEVNVYHCGGLNQYRGEEVTYDTISSDNKLCMAYYELDTSLISKDSSLVTATNDQDIPVCEIGEGIRLTVEEGEEKCNYQKISKDDLARSYQAIYGHTIPNLEQFYISSDKACYLEGDTYYCGNAETFVYSLTPEATIYRVMSKASEKMNGDIVIQDYFLRISNNKCYQSNVSNVSNEEIIACSKALEDQDEIDVTFVQEYGALYEHTFKANDSGNYYWYSSNLK